MLSFGVFGYQIYSAVQDISFFKNVNEHHFKTVKANFPTIPSRFCDKFRRNRSKSQSCHCRGYKLAKFFSLFLSNTISRICVTFENAIKKRKPKSWTQKSLLNFPLNTFSFKS